MKWLGIALLVWFQAADMVTTKIGLAVGAVEANPLLAPVIDTPIPWILKGLVVALASVLFCIKGRSSFFAWVMVAISGVVVTCNLFTILGLV